MSKSRWFLIFSFFCSENLLLYRLKQLEPLFQSPMTITKEEKKENGSPAFIVEHANGKTINDIIKAKLKEESDTVVPSTIQGSYSVYTL